MKRKGSLKNLKSLRKARCVRHEMKKGRTKTQARKVCGIHASR